MKQKESLPLGNDKSGLHIPNIHRRKFLSQMGITAAAVTGLVACSKTDATKPLSSQSVSNSVASDTDILNYAYLLEQLEAAFYIKLTHNFFSGAQWYERRKLEQIRDHEIAHREFFKTALGSSAIGEQEFDFSSIDFKDRFSVLSAAKTFEDTGVSAYNGVAYQIVTPDYLLVAGKIVSVEARHAAYLRDLLNPISFADNTVIDENGLDLAASQSEVMDAISPYLVNGGKNLFAIHN